MAPFPVETAHRRGLQRASTSPKSNSEYVRTNQQRERTRPKQGRVPKLKLVEIESYLTRRKVAKMLPVCPQYGVRACLDALLLEKGDFDNAVDYLWSKVEQTPRAEMTGSQDTRVAPIVASRPAVQVAQVASRLQHVSRPLLKKQRKPRQKKPKYVPRPEDLLPIHNPYDNCLCDLLDSSDSDQIAVKARTEPKWRRLCRMHNMMGAPAPDPNELVRILADMADRDPDPYSAYENET